MFQKIEEECLAELMSESAFISRGRIKEAYQNRDTSCYVQQETAKSGETIQIVKRAGKSWYLNSRYDPKQAAAVWAAQYDTEEINEHSVFLVFGLGDGLAIKELLKRTPQCLIMIYEPSAEIFWDGIKRETVAEVLQNSRVYIFVENICGELYFSGLQQVLDYTNYRLVVHAVLPNYDQIFAAEYKKVLEAYQSVAKLIIYTRNTRFDRGLEIARNSYGLLEDIIEQYSVAQMAGVIQKSGLEDVPAILVAAGPSLDKNVCELKKAEGKSFLMVVDTALNTVLGKGIRPDMTISVDSRKPLTLFENAETAKIPMILSQQSRMELVKQSRARRYYELDEKGYLNRICKRITGKEGKQLPTGGSVANNALSFLVEMGFKTIIFVGQDLAYPGGKEHTSFAYEGQDNNVDIQNKVYIEVEGNDGNPVLSEENMSIYRKWIECYIEENPGVRFINATEGGARIAGTEVKTLRESVTELCDREVCRNEFFTETETFFSKEDQNLLHQEIARIPQQLSELKKEVEKERALYDQLERLNEERHCDMQVIKKLLNEIGEINNQIEENDVSVLLAPYMEVITYAVGENVYRYRRDDSINTQVRDIISQGKQILDGYETGISELEKDMHLLWEEAGQKEHRT